MFNATGQSKINTKWVWNEVLNEFESSRNCSKRLRCVLSKIGGYIRERAREFNWAIPKRGKSRAIPFYLSHSNKSFKSAERFRHGIEIGLLHEINLCIWSAERVRSSSNMAYWLGQCKSSFDFYWNCQKLSYILRLFNFMKKPETFCVWICRKKLLTNETI